MKESPRFVQAHECLRAERITRQFWREDGIKGGKAVKAVAGHVPANWVSVVAVAAHLLRVDASHHSGLVVEGLRASLVGKIPVENHLDRGNENVLEQHEKSLVMKEKT